MERIRLGVIGAGSMGMKHIELVHACGMCSLVGISDVDSSRKAIADAFGMSIGFALALASIACMPFQKTGLTFFPK